MITVSSILSDSISPFLAGTAIKIVASLGITPSSITLTIKDSALISKVTDGAMLLTASGVYTYIYQTSTSDLDGEYTIIVKIVTSEGIAYEQHKFILVEQP